MKTHEQHRKHNIQNLYKFFDNRRNSFRHRHGGRDTAIEKLNPETVISFFKMYGAHSIEVDDLIAYYRRFKAASQALTTQDVVEAVELLQVNKVINS